MSTFIEALEALARFYFEARECRLCEMVMRRTQASGGSMGQIERLVLPLADGDIGAKLPPVLREFMQTGPGDV